MASQTFRYMSTDFHLLKRKNSKGKTVYYVGFLSDLPGKNGKLKYKAVKSTGQGNRAAAEKVARNMLADGKVLASRDSLRQYLLDFWDPEKSEYLKTQKIDRKRPLSSVYVMNSHQRIEQYVLPYFETRGITKLSDLDRKNILAWRNYLYENGYLPEYEPPKEKGKNKRGQRKRAKTISPATQNKARQALFIALQWAVDMGLLPYHPGSGVRRVPEDKKERPIFQLNELEKLFSEPWEDIRAFSACMLAATTGARLGECRGLQIKNVHLDKAFIDILTNIVTGDPLKPPKWGSERIGVPIPELTITALHAVIEISPFKDDPESFVFFTPSNKNRPIDIKVITDGLKKRMRAVGITGGQTFHSFRHTYVSHLRGSISEAKLIRLVGHTNTATTDKYTHVNDEDLLTVKNAVTRMIKGG